MDEETSESEEEEGIKPVLPDSSACSPTGKLFDMFQAHDMVLPIDVEFVDECRGPAGEGREHAVRGKPAKWGYKGW